MGVRSGSRRLTPWRRVQRTVEGEERIEQFGQAIDLTLWGITQVRIYEKLLSTTASWQ